MQRVLLQDELAEQFGAVHEYHNLRTPIDAIRLLCVNYPAFQKHLLESGKNGIAYKVVQADTDLELEDMTLPFGSKDLIITPVITGSGRGAGAIIAGIALVGLAIVAGPALGVTFGAGGFAAGTGAGFTAAAVAIGGNVGIALTLGGISQMLSPLPDPVRPGGLGGGGSADPGPGAITRGSDGVQSYAYRGAINSVGMGKTIPVVYGKALIGSHIVSADIEVTDDSDPLNNWIRTPSPETMTVQGEKLDFTFKETSGIKSKRYQSVPGRGTRYRGSGDYTTLPLNQKGTTYLGDVKGEATDAEGINVNKFQMSFRIYNGLYDYIAGEGSTRVDGYITVKITHYERDSGGFVGATQITVQGLMSGSQEYKWANQFAYGKIPNKDWYKVYAEIVDYKAQENETKFQITQFGYLIFND
jgi:predicted phage tail protein